MKRFLAKRYFMRGKVSRDIRLDSLFSVRQQQEHSTSCNDTAKPVVPVQLGRARPFQDASRILQSD
jgi:hypothetical protein